MRFIRSGCAIDRNRFALLCLDDGPEEEDPDHDILFVEVQHRPTIVKRKGETIRLSRVSRKAEEVAVLSREGALAP